MAKTTKTKQRILNTHNQPFIHINSHSTHSKPHHPVHTTVHQNPTNKNTTKSSISHFTAHSPAQTKQKFSLNNLEISYHSNGLTQRNTPKIIPKINPKDKRARISLTHRKIWLSTVWVPEKATRDVAAAEPWPVGPTASSAQSGGQPTGWVPSSFSPPSLGQPQLTHVSLSVGARRK
jgi:hypothetical protein